MSEISISPAEQKYKIKACTIWYKRNNFLFQQKGSTLALVYQNEERMIIFNIHETLST